MAPHLMNIPLEVQHLIGGHLHISDINSVSRTCKTLNHTFLAILYRHVVIRVPIRWSRLVSLENLLSSSGSGLKFIDKIFIAAQQQPSKGETLESEDARTAEEVAEERNRLFCLPSCSASKALNVMIRLLLMRIPEKHLKNLIWRHSCAIETSTLALLLKHQGATLRGLKITQYSEPQDSSSLLFEGLQCLSITDLNMEQRCEWVSKLIVQSRNTLRRLHLGVLTTLAQFYAIEYLSTQKDFPASFAEIAKEALPASEREVIPMLSLETLGLIGLNFETVVGGALGLEIDFSNMTTLKLRSCSGLNEAFAILMGNVSQNARLSALKLTTFIIRHEDGGHDFAQNLTAFLTSFAGLKHLRLLLEGQTQAMSKAPILEKHGRTLRTLVWDERRWLRADTSEDTSSLFSRDNNLNLISQKCPNLKALGLAMSWGGPQLVDVLPVLEILSRRMRKLQTLHLRNLPETDLTGSFLPTDSMVKGLASALLDAYAGGELSKRQKSLTTVAFGTAVYRDINIGSNHFPVDPARDFLQLRVYHVDYKYDFVRRPSATVTQVAKGTANDATCLDKNLLNEYWLA